MDRYPELLSFKDPIRTGAALATVNILFFAFWLFDISFVSLGALAGMLTVAGIKISSATGMATCGGLESAGVQGLLLAAFEPMYEYVNKGLDMFRRFLQLKFYTKRIVAGWAVLSVLGSMFYMDTLLYLICMAAFAVPALHTFVGFEQITGVLGQVKEQVEQVSSLIPRASTCAAQSE